MKFYCYKFENIIPLVYDLLDIINTDIVDELDDTLKVPKDCYYITSFFEFQHNKIIKDILLKNPKTKVIVDCVHEGIAETGEYDVFLEFYKENSLDASNTLFLTNNSLINEFKEIKFREYKFNNLHYPGFFNSFNKSLYANKDLKEKTGFTPPYSGINPLNFNVDDYKTPKPSTDFLILNRTVKAYKLSLLQTLWENEFFKDYNLRYTLIHMKCKLNIFPLEFRKELFGELGDNITKRLPDEPTLQSKQVVGIDDVNIKWLFDSKVNIVVESEYPQRETRYSDVVHISEKTWRCLAYGVPFVVSSTKNTLKWIKEYGFKTFDTCIDESYDEMEDDTRMQGVADAAKQLEKIWDSKKVQTICNFNRNLYKNKKHKRKWIQNNFLNYLENWK